MASHGLPRSLAARPGTALVLGAMLAGACAPAWPQHASILVQSSPLAGFRHHEAPALWHEIRVGDALALVRERDNVHDPNAVRVEWRGLVLGYVPRTENAAVARQMDRGAPLEARVSRLQRTRAPNRRIELEVLLPLSPHAQTGAATPAPGDSPGHP